MRMLFGSTRTPALKKRAYSGPNSINAYDSSEELTSLPYDGLSPEDLLHGKLLFAWLSDVERVIVTLKVIFGFSINEIAFVLGASERTVHEIFKRAKDRARYRKNPVPLTNKKT